MKDLYERIAELQREEDGLLRGLGEVENGDYEQCVKDFLELCKDRVDYFGYNGNKGIVGFSLYIGTIRDGLSDDGNEALDVILSNI